MGSSSRGCHWSSKGMWTIIPYIMDLCIQKIQLTNVLFPSFFFHPNHTVGTILDPRRRSRLCLFTPIQRTDFSIQSVCIDSPPPSPAFFLPVETLGVLGLLSVYDKKTPINLSLSPSLPSLPYPTSQFPPNVRHDSRSHHRRRPQTNRPREIDAQSEKSRARC